ncbi:hypothetical protein OSB04_030417 [Centaurea solstitialis]|uniref:F-box domain-containing protein n=1 Tax=Centaurea solstitialis TaxID=347529 RepID=A0AA38S8R5_9ASTR|nr:hypothetical protein OSB04_030417 [Centaurea solstitialis]
MTPIYFRRRTCYASSPSSSTRLDSLPDGIVQYILSKLSNAKDVASCFCVSKKWKELMSYHKRLCFTYGIFNKLRATQNPECIVTQMVSSVSQLEELLVVCPFTTASLAKWLSVAGSSLKDLGLRVPKMHLPYYRSRDECLIKLDCIQAARNLESLRLSHMPLTRAPKWDVFHKLRNLEIREVTMEDSVLREVLRATPNLTRLVLVECTGLMEISIELLELRYCLLRVSNGSLTLRAPKIQYLGVGGCSRIRVYKANCLKSLSICNGQIVTMVDFGGNLIALESLCIEGYGWRWDAITKMLQLATHVKHLRAEFEFIEDFQEIDFVDFFKTHPKLKSFHLLGGMFEALCNNDTTLNNVDPDFVIPCLEEVIITVRSYYNMKSPSIFNAEKVTRMVQLLLKYGNKLKAIKVNPNGTDFSEAIHSNSLKASKRLAEKEHGYTLSRQLQGKRMDSLPDGVVEYILSKLSNAKDVASCNCVSKKWKDLMSCIKRLCFPLDNRITPQTGDFIVMQMVSSVSQLEELVVACPFTTAGLASWLSVTGSSLKDLGLCVSKMHLCYESCDECLTKLECIQAARNLESLRLSQVSLARAPSWDVFHKLRSLEITKVMMEDSVLREALRATTNLTRLVLVECRGLMIIWIELLELQHCLLRACGDSLTLIRAPKIQYLEVRGCSRIKVHHTNCLKSLSIGNSCNVVTMVDFGGNLIALESLCIEGYGWHWDAITKMLQLATHVKHLRAEFEFIQDFQEIDFVDFFKPHPKLKSFHTRGGMFEALCNNHTSLKNANFVIPCLEEVVINVKSAYNRKSASIFDAKKVTRMVESLLKYGNKIKTIKVTSAKDFSEEIHRGMDRLWNGIEFHIFAIHGFGHSITFEKEFNSILSNFLKN